MSLSNEVHIRTRDALIEQLGGDKISLPDSSNTARHLRDFMTAAPASADIVALAYPHNTQDVSRILTICNDAGIPVVPQGGMTGMAGGGVPVGPSVVLSLERMRRIEEVDVDAYTMTVEAGVPLEAVQTTADAAGLFFPLDIGSRGSCLVGGNAATNAGGNRVLRFGMMRDLILGVEAVLADGTIINSLHKMIKNNSGYDLRQVFIGSEGTLGVITRLVLRLYPKPKSVCTALCALQDYQGILRFLGHAKAELGSGLTAFEAMWPAFYRLGTEALGRQPPLATTHGAYVLLEMMGVDAAGDQARFEAMIGAGVEAGFVEDAVVAQSVREARALWAIRDCPGEFPRVYWPQMGFDVSVSTGEIGSLVEEITRNLLARWPNIQMVYFGHVADGNLHLSARMPEGDIPEHDIESVVYATVAERRGSVSAEHGIGLHKRPFLHHSRSPAEMAMMRSLKAALDPRGTLNPGKIF